MSILGASPFSGVPNSDRHVGQFVGLIFGSSKSEAVVVICILACFSWNAHRRLRRAQERTVSPDDGENGGPTSPVSLRSSPGLLAHGSYPFLLRGTLGSVFFVLAVLPLILVIVTWRRV